MTEETATSGQAEQTQANTPVQGGETTNESHQQQAQDAGTEGTEQQQDTQAANPEGETEGEETPRKRESGSQRYKRERDMLRARVAELEASSPKGEQRQQIDPEPKESDFNGDYLAFEKAHRKWEISSTVGQVFERQEAQTRERAKNEARMATMLDHQERIDSFRGKVTDFDEVISKMKGTNVNQDVMFDVMESDKSDLIVYHLAKNPDKVRELNAMSERERAKEIGRLEGSLRMPAAKRETQAGKPLTEIKGATQVVPDPSKMSMDEYVAWRSKGGGLRGSA